jgi:hypothetical protein
MSRRRVADPVNVGTVAKATSLKVGWLREGVVKASASRKPSHRVRMKKASGCGGPMGSSWG